MDSHLVSAFIDAITDTIVDKLSRRLPPLAKATPRAATAMPPDPAIAVAAGRTGHAEYLTTREAAAVLGVTVKGLEAMRANGRGPKFTRVGKAVRYRRSDL